MAANGLGRRIELLVQDAMKDLNDQVGAWKIGGEVGRQVAVTIEATLPKVLENNVTAAIESAMVQAQEKHVLGPAAQPLREQILAHANFLFDLWRGRTSAHSRPTIVITGSGSSPRIAKLSGIKSTSLGKAEIVNYVEGADAASDLLALEALYESTKAMLTTVIEEGTSEGNQTFECWSELEGGLDSWMPESKAEERFSAW